MNKPDRKSDRNTSRVSIARLTAKPNVWADWLGDEIGGLHWMRYAAVLLRDMPVADVVNRIAPALLAADDEAQAAILESLAEYPLEEGEAFGFEHWLAFWDNWANEEDADDVVDRVLAYAEHVRRAATTFDGSPDIRLFAEYAAAMHDRERPLLWFLLNGIRAWAREEPPLEDIEPENRWLVTVEPAWWLRSRNHDGLGLLYAYMYERFRSGGRCPAQPLPDGFSIEPDDDVDEECGPMPLGETGTLAQAVFFDKRGLPDLFGQQQEPLPMLLHDDPRTWTKHAGNTRRLRAKRLLQAGGFTPTATGLAEAP